LINEFCFPFFLWAWKVSRSFPSFRRSSFDDLDLHAFVSPFIRLLFGPRSTLTFSVFFTRIQQSLADFLRVSPIRHSVLTVVHEVIRLTLLQRQ
jgi:hypothetical protein